MARLYLHLNRTLDGHCVHTGVARQLGTRSLWKSWGKAIARQYWSHQSQWISQCESQPWQKPPPKLEFLAHHSDGLFITAIWSCTRSTWLHPPVDEVLLLQVLHGRGDLGGHVEQHDGADLLAVALAQVVQQVPVGHVLGHDVKRGLQGAHTCRQRQVNRASLPHHCSWFNTAFGTTECSSARVKTSTYNTQVSAAQSQGLFFSPSTLWIERNMSMKAPLFLSNIHEAVVLFFERLQNEKRGIMNTQFAFLPLSAFMKLKSGSRYLSAGKISRLKCHYRVMWGTPMCWAGNQHGGPCS